MIFLQSALKSVVRQQQTFAVERRFGECGTGELPDGGDFGEGSAGRDLMQDLLFARRRQHKDADQTGSHQKKTGTRIALSENQLAANETLRRRHF